MSVKTTCYGENHGYDGENEGKKTAHCNRYDGKSPCIHNHVWQIFTIIKGGVYTFEKALYRYPTIQVMQMSVYRGTFRNTFDEFHNIRIDISMQIKQKGFVILPNVAVERVLCMAEWFTQVVKGL